MSIHAKDIQAQLEALGDRLIEQRDVLLLVCRRVLAREDRGYTLFPEDADELREAIRKAQGAA